jgi:hypothetical protein
MGTTTIFTILPADFLGTIFESVGKSYAALFWQVVTALWSSYWPIILLVLFLIVAYELLTRNGTAHYNSRNGFSPGFNRLVGSGTYLLLQAAVYGFVHFVFGDAAYLHVWPYLLHLVVFASTGLLLNLTGFWVYWKPPRF